MVSSLSAESKLANYIDQNCPNVSADWRNFMLLEAMKMVKTKEALDAYNGATPNPDAYPTTYKELVLYIKNQVENEGGRTEDKIKAETKSRFLKLVNENPKAYTLTGHPTEVLSRHGVKARNNLRAHILQNWQALNNSASASIPDEIKTGLNELATAIEKHPAKRKTMAHEQRDAKIASEKYFDAVFLEYENIQEALEFVGCNTEIDDEIEALLKLFTWAFDNDGKPELTPLAMQDALDLFRSAVLAKYVKELAVLRTKLEGQPELQNQVLKLSFKLLNSIRFINPENESKGISDIEHWATKVLDKDDPIAKNMLEACRLFKSTEKTRENIAHADAPLNFDNYPAEAASELRNLTAKTRTIHRQQLQTEVPTLDEFETIYFETEDKFLEAFTEFRDLIKASDASAEAKSFTSKLAHAAKCFGLTAARAEFRQSVEVYQLAYIKLKTLLNAPAGVDINNIQKVAEYLADLKQNQPDELKKLKAIIAAELEKIKKQNWFADCRESLATADIPEEHRPEYYFADLVEKLQLVSKHNRRAPIILGAECNNEEDAVLMAVIYTLSSTKDKTANTIMPLVEYNEAVVRHAEITANLSTNKAFMTLLDSRFEGIMLAGSDASKTISNATFYYTSGALYMGCGSGLQRNAVSDAPKVTDQGIFHGQTSSEEIAARTQLTRTTKIAESLGIERKKTLTDAEVVINIGNRLKLQEKTALQDADLKRNAYYEKYCTAELSAYFKLFTQKEVEAKYSFAARPDVRPEYSHPDSPKEANINPSVFGVRAIGFNRRARAKFGTLILSAEAADVLGADSKGYIENVDAAVEKYRTDPFIQHVINGAIDDISIVHANEAGWAEVQKILREESGINLNIRREINAEGNPVLRINQLSFDYQEILTPQTKDRARLINAVMKICGHNKDSEEYANAVIGAVMHDWEHLKSTRAITQVLARMNNQHMPNNYEPEVMLKQLTKINKAHGDNLMRNRIISRTAAESYVKSDDKSGAHACIAFMAETVPTTYTYSTVCSSLLQSNRCAA